MGILDRVFGGGEEEVSEFDDEFGGEEFEEDVVEEEEVEEPEWDTYYQAAGDILQEEGFADMQEFINKAMTKRIGQSPMYRDKIESGMNTMDRVTGSMQRIREIRVGEEEGGTDYQQMSEDVRAANQLMDQIDRLGGKEEQIVDEVIGIAHEFVDGYRGQNRSSGSVRTGVERSTEEI